MPVFLSKRTKREPDDSRTERRGIKKESFLFAFAEEAEEAEKDIDEIQVEGECAEEGEFHITFVNRLFIEHELADLLGIIDR